jgi:hypothetical protein
MAHIKVLHMGCMDLNQNFDYEGGNDFVLVSLNDLGPMARSISMPTALASFKRFATPSNLDLDLRDVAWEFLKA